MHCLAALGRLVVWMYNKGYEAGHTDTVLHRYTPIPENEMTTANIDEVDALADIASEALSYEIGNLKPR